MRVGIDPETRLRWLLDFGNLDPASLSAEQRAAVIQEARAFVVLQQLDPAIRGRMRSWPEPTDAMPDVLSHAEVWSAQVWLNQGLDLLRRSQKWSFRPRVTYELDVHRGLFWTRMRSTSRLEQFKALAYDAFRDARFKFRGCPECKRPFVRSGARGTAPRSALKPFEPASGASRILKRTARSAVSSTEGQRRPS